MTNSNSLLKKITSLLLSVVFVLTSFAAVDFSSLSAIEAKADGEERFLMAYFTGNLQTEQQIKFAVSTDGANFKPLYGGNAVLQEKSTDTNNYNGYTYTDGVRDPYIFDGHDGYYYCIATDLEATAYGFWGNQSQMVLWRSQDLINWSDAYYINVAQIANAKRGTSFTNDNFQRTWAPEVFYENGQYMIYFALAGGDYTATRMHYMITDDLFDWTHYSAPQVLYDPGYDDIDADIIKEGSTYYMFYKDETPGRSTVCLATAENLTGPYTYQGQFDTTSATGGIEGCEVYTVGSNYYLVADRFGAAGNFAIYNMGTSLLAVKNAVNNGHISVTSSPISTVEELYGFTNLTPRHGSIMHISESQYDALVAASGGVTDDDIMYNFTKAYSRTSDGWAYENAYADSSLHNAEFMFKENGSSVKVAHDSGYITLRNATIFINDETIRSMLPDDVYTVSFDYALESNTNLSAPIFALGTGSGAPSVNTDYVMIFGNGDIWVRKSGENSDTFVASKSLKVGVTYHYDIVSDGTNITFYRDGDKIGQIAATVDFPTTGTRYAAFGFTDGHSSSGYGYGSYSKIRFRDRAVSASEIKAEADKVLLYQKNSGNETINGKNGALNVSHNGDHNVVEPLISKTAASYSIAGWVNPGSSIDYNSVVMGIGSRKWSPGPYGRYLAIREDGTILFNYCSGSNSGGNWSQHYANVDNAFTLSADTWSYIQVNIVPISDNQVKVVVFKDGVQSKSQDITLTTVVDNNDTTGNDYAYGMLGMLQLTTNYMFLGRMDVPSWWQNENGTTYVKDVRFYAQAMDPDKLYETEVAKEYVTANIASYDVSANTFNAKAYHVNAEAVNGYNNLVYSPQNTTYWNTCAYDTSGNRNQNDDCGRVWYLGYKLPMPQNSVMVYDGVSGHTPAVPIQLEFKRFTSYGNYKTKVQKIYFDGTDINGTNSDKFELNDYWYGFGTDYTKWYGATYSDSYYEASNEDWRGKFGSKNNKDDFTTTHDGTSSMFWWNALHYKGTGDTTNYYEHFSTLTFDVYSVSSYNWNSWTTEHIQNEGANVYVINYAPVYNALKSTGFTGVPNGENGTRGQSIKTLAAALSSDAATEAQYTTSSVDQVYYAAYKLMNCNPNNYPYSSGVDAAVKECATDIKEAMVAFNNVNLQLRADFSDVDDAYSDAQDIIDNNSSDYTASSISALQTVLDNAVYAINKDEEYRANAAAANYQDAIDDEETAIRNAINSLVSRIVITFRPYSGDDTVIKFDPNTTAAEVEAAAPGHYGAPYFNNGNHYEYYWEEAFTAATENKVYHENVRTVAHIYSSYTHIDSTSTHTASCSVNGQSHTDTLPCDYDSVYHEASGNNNSYTTYTCKFCGYSYNGDYGAQDFTAYDNALEDYETTLAGGAYTIDSKAAYTAAVNAARIDKDDVTLSQNAITNAAADIIAAKSNLDEVADLSALDESYAKADALLTSLIGRAPVYTTESVQALVDKVNANGVSNYVNADTTVRANFGQSVETTANALAYDINAAYEALETVSETNPSPEVADAIEVYEEAVQKVTKLDPDAYNHTDSITSAINAANALVGSENGVSYSEGTINTINADASADDYDEATGSLLTALANSIKTYSVITSGVASTGYTNGTATGDYSPYTATYGATATCISSDSNTVWFLEIETGTTHKQRAYQGIGSVLKIKVMGDTTIEAVKGSSEKRFVRIIRDYGDSSESTEAAKVPTNFADYVDAGSEFTLPAAPALAFYSFDGYFIGDAQYDKDDVITINEDTEIVAKYSRNEEASCAINATDINNSSVGSNSFKYNDKVELDGGSSAYAWVEATNDAATAFRPFFIGREVSFFASESTTLKAVTEEEFAAFNFKLPAINMRKDGAIVVGTKVVFNGQVVAADMDNVQEYGVLVGVGAMENSDLVIENSGKQTGYTVLRAKSTKPIGEANQFAIGVNGLASVDYIYRGYIIYKDGDNLKTVYTDIY